VRNICRCVSNYYVCYADRGAFVYHPQEWSIFTITVYSMVDYTQLAASRYRSEDLQAPLALCSPPQTPHCLSPSNRGLYLNHRHDTGCLGNLKKVVSRTSISRDTSQRDNHPPSHHAKHENRLGPTPRRHHRRLPNRRPNRHLQTDPNPRKLLYHILGALPRHVRQQRSYHSNEPRRN
jgi:hypothetical protein